MSILTIDIAFKCSIPNTRIIHYPYQRIRVNISTSLINFANLYVNRIEYLQVNAKLMATSTYNPLYRNLQTVNLTISYGEA